MNGLHYIFNKFIHASMHSITSLHTFSACQLMGIVMGVGGKVMSVFHCRCVNWGFFNDLNHTHVIQPAECCTNAANIHPPAMHLPPYANIHPPTHLMSST